MGWWKFRETCLVQAGVLLKPEEADHAIQTYRETFPMIPALWKDLQRAAIEAVRTPGSVAVAAGGRIRFKMETHWLRMRLPSGRFIWYNKPLIEKGKFDTDVITYMSVNPKTRKWERTHTYGGRLTENATQGLCRDLLCEATKRLEDEGYNPVTLVHDEIIAEPERGHGSIGEMCELMSIVPPWAAGFALSAKGARGIRYQKT
jgi:DNA polymerase